ncbi:SDR family oxidoreductase [Lentzea aerocolonigenes]|uniref:SDR family oxidoreductase n=1 Tax=Lentzea aerocolonigenes TaxID=68170 RepID=UPI00055C9CFC|nr:SDR family oxidoreductase [Lentzea aerocolonigenes]MCP2244175.1 NADP-dependent 3-hydroxy acid dehydrogenase YdfG [Lentzea aerocolonigenes]
MRGSVAFITGGARGIGLGIARALGKRGVKLALADVDEPALARAAGELAPVETFRLDVRDRDAFAAAADSVERTLGPVDLLFNNAGIVPHSAVEELTYAKWDVALAVNLTGVINGIQTFLPRMIERRAGYVVNTASVAGLVSDPNLLYATAKFAVVGLSESLRLNVAKHGIGVSVLCPGPVDTGIVAHTRSLEEGVALRDELVPAVAAFLAGGPGIDAVGEMVVAGVERRSPWIFTGDEVRPHLEKRAAALLEAF